MGLDANAKLPNRDKTADEERATISVNFMTKNGAGSAKHLESGSSNTGKLAAGTQMDYISEKVKAKKLQSRHRPQKRLSWKQT